ncbi:UNVERIFIED_CONTAM: hypothetical protein GTU68_036676 [Idotea baltica]|nr:hypothetical protein [Idotea baltica]
MVDLKKQLLPIRKEVEVTIAKSLDQTDFIQGSAVSQFEKNLQEYLGCNHVITCGNGTDAIQIALMVLDLQPGDEVLVPAFTYISAIEVIVLLQLVPVFIDVELDSFNMDTALVKEAISEKTKAIVVVHLFGQMADMDMIMRIAQEHELYVLEDNAQSFGAKALESGSMAGTIGHIGCTSFFPTKILGGMGDGGAINTDNPVLAQKMKMIAKHGQTKKYHHKRVGINSRLDTIQAAILKVKLQYVDDYISKRKSVAAFYNWKLGPIGEIIIPQSSNFSDHVYHQYTLRIKNGKRDLLQEHLWQCDIPTAIYYPIVANQQEAYKSKYAYQDTSVSNSLTKQVLSLPMHTELSEDQLDYICHSIFSFYK